MCAGKIGTSYSEGHAVLQLVTETESAARLIEAGSCPEAAGERLIQHPAIEHDVHGALGSFDLDRAQHIIPVTGDIRKDLIEVKGTVAFDQLSGDRVVVGIPQNKGDVATGAGCQLNVLFEDAAG